LECPGHLRIGGSTVATRLRRRSFEDAQAAIDRLAAVSTHPGFVLHETALLLLRALLARELAAEVARDTGEVLLTVTHPGGSHPAGKPERTVLAPVSHTIGARTPRTQPLISSVAMKDISRS
jgi:hypothetical protein